MYLAYILKHFKQYRYSAPFNYFYIDAHKKHTCTFLLYPSCTEKDKNSQLEYFKNFMKFLNFFDLTTINSICDETRKKV